MRFKRVTCLTRGISHEHTCHLCPKLLLPLLICSRPPKLLLAISLLPPQGDVPVLLRDYQRLAQLTEELSRALNVNLGL